MQDRFSVQAAVHGGVLGEEKRKSFAQAVREAMGGRGRGRGPQPRGLEEDWDVYGVGGWSHQFAPTPQPAQFFNQPPPPQYSFYPNQPAPPYGP